PHSPTPSPTPSLHDALPIYRPFTMKRYPDGWQGKFFFQKDAPVHMPEWIPRFRALVSTREKPRAKKWVNFPLVNDELALLWMVKDRKSTRLNSSHEWSSYAV